MTCQHCRRRPACQRRSGLCYVCYAVPALRARYRGERGEPTAEDVERTVAEQLRALPEWWEAKSRRQA